MSVNLQLPIPARGAAGGPGGYSDQVNDFLQRVDDMLPYFVGAPTGGDDTALWNNAIATGRTLQPPSGPRTYLIYGVVNFNKPGQVVRLFGNDATNGTAFELMAADAAIKVGSKAIIHGGGVIDGNSLATNCLILDGASECDVENLVCDYAAGVGIVFGASGNNNHARLRNTKSRYSGSHALEVEEQANNNALRIENFNGFQCAGIGALLRGTGGRLTGAEFQFTGDWPVQFGATGDASSTTGWVADGWLEGCAKRTATVSFTSGDTTINDTGAVLGDVGKTVSCTGIPASATVVSSTPGVSFTISLAATANESSISLSLFGGARGGGKSARNLFTARMGDQAGLSNATGSEDGEWAMLNASGPQTRFGSNKAGILFAITPTSNRATISAVGQAANQDLRLDPQGTGTVWVAADNGHVIVANSGSNLGFYGSSGGAKGSVTGSRAGNAALQSLISYLAAKGLLTDGTSA